MALYKLYLRALDFYPALEYQCFHGAYQKQAAEFFNALRMVKKSFE